jgi:hypothetical protein
MKPIWLASYPRSGNTLVRTILYQCFNLKTGSIYVNDLGGKSPLENYVGHIEHNENQSITFPPGSLPIIKTHKFQNGDNSTIYVVRDGRAACASLWEFTNPKVSMIDIIEGNHRFGKWCDHVESWSPLSRPNTLLLRYEDILEDLNKTLYKLSTFLEREITHNMLPSRDMIADKDGKWVRKKTDWQNILSDKELESFYRVNSKHMQLFGYK